MKKTVRIISVVLSLIMVVLVLAPMVFAAAAQGRITGSGVRMRNKATTVGSTILTELAKGTVVTINSTVTGQQAETGGGTTWYYVTYGGYTGYVYGKYVEEIATPTYDTNFEKNLLNFPESYRSALRTVHSAYPNWVFVADNVGISLDTAIDYEYSATTLTSTKKWVELSFGEKWRDPRVDISNPLHIKESRWTYASRETIAYFMDPRNALVVTNSQSAYPNIFTFLQQSFDAATQTEAGLKTVVSGTFMANGYNGDTNAYISDIMQAARESGVSPYVIASTIRIEQGNKGTSSLISGTYAGYEGYYNFFNYGAYGDNVVKNGLEYAKSKGWNSRRASIIGGAKLYASGYINVGQDTYYYMDFNVKKSGSHQYATNVYDQCTKAVSMRSVCTANASGALTFKIPVYSSLPAAVYGIPTGHVCSGEIRNAVAATCTADGYTGDTYCKTCGKLMSSGSVVKATGHTAGEATNKVAATCTATGYTGDIYCKTCGVLLSAGSVTGLADHIKGGLIIDCVR